VRERGRAAPPRAWLIVVDEKQRRAGAERVAERAERRLPFGGPCRRAEEDDDRGGRRLPVADGLHAGPQRAAEARAGRGDDRDGPADGAEDIEAARDEARDAHRRPMSVMNSARVVS